MSLELWISFCFFRVFCSQFLWTVVVISFCIFFPPLASPSGVYYPTQSMSRFVRPPPSAPEAGTPYLEHYGPYLSERVVSPQYPQPQGYPTLAQPMYPPHYDGRRVYPPVQPYQREDVVRGSPVPIDIPPAAVPLYVPESRDRYQQTEAYCPVAPHLGQIRPSCHRVWVVHCVFVVVLREKL